MTPSGENGPMSPDALVRGARREAERDRRLRAEETKPVASHLAQIGVLGWMIVMPMLIGVFGGSWLDRRFHTGLFYTAPLLMLGAAAGCWFGWRWMQKT